MTCQNEGVSERGGELMDVDNADSSYGCVTEIRENGLLLWPVLPQEYGEGLPYAPENWPSPGDVWGWRVGKRIAVSGFYLDRYLYLPLCFQKSRRKKDGFASKLSVEQYIRARFPGSDVHAFFSSFSWKIPSKQAYMSKDERSLLRITSEEVPEQCPSDSLLGVAVCKAGNRFCSSLVEEDISLSTAAQSCDVCCSEPGFCRDCCCILCCNIVDVTLGGYSFINCEATIHGDLICGHLAHVNCALRSYMAGTVGGSVGLDTEYYCRRCDTKTDLTNHVTKLWKTCKSIESRDDIEKMLSVGACLLRGSQKKVSQKMLNNIESASQKVKAGTDLQDVWKVEVDVVTVPSGEELDYMNHVAAVVAEDNRSLQNEYLKLEEEIDQVLQELRKSKENEFRIAQERLHAQKDYIFTLCKQVDKEKSELTWHTPLTNCDSLLGSVVVREEQIIRELSKLEEMKKVAKGFGKTPKDILKEHFDLED